MTSDGWPKLLRDVKGLAVRTKFPLSNGMMTIPAGAIGTITGGANWARLAFEAKPCECCGVQMRISRVEKYCFEPLARES
jgi:hypothetical protein